MGDNGREDKLENDLFFVCSVIEHIGRSTKNKRGDVVKKLGEEEIARLLELADVLHCEPVEVTAGDLIKRCGFSKEILIMLRCVNTPFQLILILRRFISV